MNTRDFTTILALNIVAFKLKMAVLQWCKKNDKAWLSIQKMCRLHIPDTSLNLGSMFKGLGEFHPPQDSWARNRLSL